MSLVYLVQEIEDEIFQLAARMYPLIAHEMIPVSKRVQGIVEPIVYESFCFSFRGYLPPRWPETADFMAFYNSVLRSPRVDIITSYILNVYIRVDAPQEFLIKFFPHCSNLHNVSFWPLASRWKVEWQRDCGSLFLPSSLTLRSISTTRPVFRQLASYGVMFPNLTHACLDDEADVIHKDDGISCLADISTAWAPALSVLELLLNFEERFLTDVKAAMTIAPQVQKLYLVTEYVWFKNKKDAWKELGKAMTIKYMRPRPDKVIDRWRNLNCRWSM